MRAHLVASVFLFAVSALGSLAHASSAMYQLKVTNTSAMPISGGVVYIISGQGGTSEVGQMPSAGFVTLCQTGNSAPKFEELKADAKVYYSAQTSGPIMPGASLTIDVPMPRSKMDSVHFEAMYGKSKEACASISISGQRFYNLHDTGEVLGRDEVVLAGAAQTPMLPMMSSSEYEHVCDYTSAAVECLRTLAPAKSGTAMIGYFPGYLPSVLSYIENRYGASETQALVIPTSGAVHYNLNLK